MKKLTAMLLCLALLLGLAACGEPAKTKGDGSTAAATDSAGSGSATAGGKKALVVYYSATGSTRQVAEYLAGAAGADVFELVPQQPYTEQDLNWSDENSRVSREHENEALREVALQTTAVPNWSAYDTVFIGYPIWWGVAAWPVNGFVKANDFTGKTVIPFCTSASSGLGDSATQLSSLAKGGSWQKGQRFSSGASEEKVADWFKTLS